MKLTKSKLKQIIREELTREGVWDKIKGAVGLGGQKHPLAAMDPLDNAMTLLFEAITTLDTGDEAYYTTTQIDKLRRLHFDLGSIFQDIMMNEVPEEGSGKTAYDEFREVFPDHEGFQHDVGREKRMQTTRQFGDPTGVKSGRGRHGLGKTE